MIHCNTETASLFWRNFQKFSQRKNKNYPLANRVSLGQGPSANTRGEVFLGGTEGFLEFTAESGRSQKAIKGESMTRTAIRRFHDEDGDGLVAFPPVAVVRQRLRTTVKEFATSSPGRRAAALAAVWIAATGCESDLSQYDAEEALRTYRLAESELRAELRMTVARAINNEPHPDTRNTMIDMLERLETLEQEAVAPKPQRRRRRR